LSKQQIHFDPFSNAFSENPYRIYRELRESGKAHYFEPQNLWLLSRYEDVSAIARNPKMVRSLDGLETVEQTKKRQRAANWHDMPYHERVVQFSLLDSDGDIHRRLRKQIFGEFTARPIAHLENVVQTFVDGLLDKLQQRDDIEFINDFAAHIPGYVIGHLLGAPEENCSQLRLWSEQIVQFFDVDRSDEKKTIAENATKEFYHFLEDLRAERARKPQDDLISKMIIDEQEGRYTRDEFISTCMLILMAGHGSTIDVLGSGMHTLLQHPQSMRALREDPELMPTAIQEMFRFESPLPFFHRHALEDVKIAGQHFKKGTTFGLLYGSANRDPEQFEQADEFIITRTPNRHLAFGQGAHLCLGNNLARLNMRIIFDTLLHRFSNIQLVDERVIYKSGLSVRGPKALNISWQVKA
jgi:cytochrome P450